VSRFQFRLGSLLRLREHTEDQARQELADSERAVQSIESQLEALAARKAAAASEAFGPTEFSPLTALQAGYAHSHLLGDQEAAEQDRLAEATQEHERSRDQALQAHRATELLKRLRERQRERHHTAQQRAEDRQTDEAGTQIAARRTLGS
jgi:flagellar export protein FliJ